MNSLAIDYTRAIFGLEQKGKELYGSDFKTEAGDREILCRLICYFLRDEPVAEKLGIKLNKGILLTGPIGSGKTSLMNLMRYFRPTQERFILRPCREVSFEFIKSGYDTIHKYSHFSFEGPEPRAYCFDDLGVENNLKFFGNECNVMAEVILSRYDLFVNRKLITHLTTNLSASEIEKVYGNRVRSRLREMMNLVSFGRTVRDKRG